MLQEIPILMTFKQALKTVVRVSVKAMQFPDWNLLSSRMRNN